MQVRVLGEVELPGHGYHSIAQPLGLPTCSTADEFPGPVIRGSNRSAAVLEQLVLEMSSLFPDQAFHIGGDETAETNGKWPCGWENTKDLERRVLRALQQRGGKIVMAWDEVGVSTGALQPRGLPRV